MKKMLTLLLAVVMLLTAFPAMADTMKNPIPKEIKALFDVPAWEDYYIPVCTDHPEYYAFAKTDEIGGYCAGIIILRKESEQRNVLCLLEKKNGKWRITARNHEALLRGKHVPYLYCEMNDQLEVHWGTWDQETAGCLYFNREDNTWRLTYVQDMAKNIWAYVSSGSILYYDAENQGETASEQKAYGVYDNRFAAFDWEDFPKNIKEGRERLSNPPVTPTDFYTPVNITLRANEKYDVFAAPGRDSYRAANGRAVMSTNDWVQIFGEEDGWLLVQYDISSDRMRFGYIAASALPRNKTVNVLRWYDLPEQTIQHATYVTDDPLASGSIIHSLYEGEAVRLLSEFGSWYYIETTADNGKTLRGFVPKTAIEIVYDDADLVG